MLFFKRIGSEKRSYTITLVPQKLQLTSGTNTDIQLTFNRGSHSAKTVSYKPVNRQIAFKNERLSILSTMYYNNATRIYVEKLATISILGKQLGGVDIYEIDSFEFDIAEYIGKQQQRVKFQFDSGTKLIAVLEFVLNQKNPQNSSTGFISERRIEDKENKVSTQSQQKPLGEDAVFKGGSQSLQMYENEVREKNLQLQKLRQQNKRLNGVVNQMSQKQTNVGSKNNQSLLDKLFNQNQVLKKKVVELQIQLSHSDTKMKRLTGNEMQVQKIIKSQAKRIKDLQDELQESKNKMAVLLQDCFEQGDAELMSFIEQRLKN